MHASVVDRLASHALSTPDATAMVHGDENWTYAALLEEVEGFAAHLRAGDVTAGDRVAVFVEKSFAEVVAILGIWRVGGVYVAINPVLKAPQITHILSDADVGVVVTTALRAGPVARAVAEVPGVTDVVLTDADTTPVGFRDGVAIRGITAERRDGPPAQCLHGDVATLLYTSGSTGTAKGVVLTHGNVVFAAETLVSSLGIQSDARTACVLPFTFDYGLHQLTASLWAGAAAVLVTYYGIPDVVNAVRDARITGLALIPALWLRLLEEDWDTHTFASLRYGTSAGGVLPKAAQEVVQSRLPGRRFVVGYGLTEAFRATWFELRDGVPGTIGRPTAGTKAWVVDAEGQRCPDGEVGEIVLRGPHVALGYWGDATRTAQRFRPYAQAGVPDPREHVLFTGDMGWVDPDGCLVFVGRNDSLIKTSGYRVSPAEVEEGLQNTGHVAQACVFGVTHPVLGAEVVACVSLKHGAAIDARQLQRKVSRLLPNYMVPRRIRILDTLPLNKNSKIDRAALERDWTEE